MKFVSCSKHGDKTVNKKISKDKQKQKQTNPQCMKGQRKKMTNMLLQTT